MTCLDCGHYDVEHKYESGEGRPRSGECRSCTCPHGRYAVDAKPDGQLRLIPMTAKELNDQREALANASRKPGVVARRGPRRGSTTTHALTPGPDAVAALAGEERKPLP